MLSSLLWSDYMDKETLIKRFKNSIENVPYEQITNGEIDLDSYLDQCITQIELELHEDESIFKELPVKRAFDKDML